MGGDLDIADEEAIADVDEFLVSKGFFLEREPAGRPLMPSEGRIACREQEGEQENEQGRP
jgi:hypothetical protein